MARKIGTSAAASVPLPRKPVDNKITVNIPSVDIGMMDLLLQEGFYRSRADLIRRAIGNELARRAKVIELALEHLRLRLGSEYFDEDRLLGHREANEPIVARLVGHVEIAEDVTPELALEVIHELTIIGTLRAPQPVIDALGPRVRRAPVDRF